MVFAVLPYYGIVDDVVSFVVINGFEWLVDSFLRVSTARFHHDRRRVIFVSETV